MGSKRSDFGDGASPGFVSLSLSLTLFVLPVYSRVVDDAYVRFCLNSKIFIGGLAKDTTLGWDFFSIAIFFHDFVYNDLLLNEVKYCQILLSSISANMEK